MVVHAEPALVDGLTRPLDVSHRCGRLLRPDVDHRHLGDGEVTVGDVPPRSVRTRFGRQARPTGALRSGSGRD